MGDAHTGASKVRSSTVPVLLLTAFCALSALTLGLNAPYGHPTLVLWSCVFLGTSALEGAVARFSAGNQRWTLSVTEAVLVTALVCAPGAWVAVPGMLGLFVAHLARRRRDPVKLAFNASMYALVFALGGCVADRLGGGIVGAAAGGLAFWASNLLLLHTVMSLVMGPPKALELLRSTLPLSALHMSVNVVVGLTAGVLAREHPLGALGILAPLGAVLACYEAITRRVDENHMLSLLLDGQDHIRPRALEEYARVVLATAATMFSSPTVRLLVLNGTDGPLQVTLEPDHVSTRTEVATATDLDQAWVLRSLASEGPIAVGHTLATSWCTIRVGPAQQPLAVLVVHKDSGSGAGVSRRDQRLARALATRAEAWFRMAGAYDPDAATTLAGDKADDAAALAGLRSAVYQLVTSAEQLQDSGPEALAAELHRVQRAVTTLLGSSRRPQPAAAAPMRVMSKLTPLAAVHAVDAMHDMVALNPPAISAPVESDQPLSATARPGPGSGPPRPAVTLAPAARLQDWVTLPCGSENAGPSAPASA